MPKLARLISRQTKIRLNKRFATPAVTYGAEMWTLSAEDVRALHTVKRKIYRRICGLKKDGEVRKVRNSREINKIIGREYIAR